MFNDLYLQCYLCSTSVLEFSSIKKRDESIWAIQSLRGSEHTGIGPPPSVCPCDFKPRYQSVLPGKNTQRQESEYIKTAVFTMKTTIY